MKRECNKLHILLICVALALATIIAFEPVRHNEFIGLDDDLYIVDNSYVKASLTREGFIWAFTTAHAFNWHPLTWITHMWDCDCRSKKKIRFSKRCVSKSRQAGLCSEMDC